LPSVGRPRRISASKLSNPFAGTDFSYADLMAIKVENFDHQITSSTADTVVLESQAKTTAFAKEIGYARSVVTALAGSFIPTEIAYFDRKGRQFKVQRLGDAVTAPNGSHVLRSRVMTVLDTGHETELQLGAVDFSSGLTTSDFSSRRL
ncbi:MAG: outer membrane lipoprotein-sorting protein, partial [Pseudomonadota bacterium]